MGWQTPTQCCWLVLLGAGLGLAVNAVSPRGIAYLTPPKAAATTQDLIALTQAEQLWRAGAIFLDARSAADYELGHIGNALSLPVLNFEQAFAHVGLMLSPNFPIIVYCDGEDCELSHQLKDRLVKEGYQDVRVLANGWTLWRQAGLPTTAGNQP